MNRFNSLKYWLVLKYHRMVKKVHFPNLHSGMPYLLILVISVCFIIAILSHRPGVSVATIDEKKIFASFVTELGKRNISDEQVKKVTTRFTRIYRQVLAQHAQKNHLVILKKEQVLVSDIDITEKIALQINHEMGRPS